MMETRDTRDNLTRLTLVLQRYLRGEISNIDLLAHCHNDPNATALLVQWMADQARAQGLNPWDKQREVNPDV